VLNGFDETDILAFGGMLESLRVTPSNGSATFIPRPSSPPNLLGCANRNDIPDSL